MLTDTMLTDTWFTDTWFTDTHAHLNRLDLAKHATTQNALQAAKIAKVHRIMAIMCDFDEYEDIRSIVKTPIDGLTLGMSVGIHPCQDTLHEVTFERLLDLAKDCDVWAIGETGLDYYWSKEHINEQKSSFSTHIHVSQALKKPIIVHTRDARCDTLDVLAAEKAEHGIIHCFTEDYATAKKALDLGFYISLSGIVTFKNATNLQEVAKKLPLDRILIETDSPYLAPIPKRGKPNEPAFVPYVAEFLAKLYDIPLEKFAKITNDNFDNLLNQYT
ncbi:TatD-related deoxyribonuclease [Moraxella macacae 0408225]|uniref:TatD-related deoxyribonuclease n=1 Tax=Moraxella macacae 0408225 TaxID=1230338 RepID=L2F858_9GAMM|nr:TatD family hydrolase [Moraxella macacae]ELA08643.1 TatD-related deoxyribonuclease [Moraxella macacae 0408225]